MTHQKPGPSTRSVHLAGGPDTITSAVVPPLVLSSAFVSEDLAQWRRRALNQEPGYLYSRNRNPTTDRFEQRMAALEGAESATSFATGMAAVTTTLFALLSPDDRAVTVRDAYGATFLLFTQELPRFGLHCDVLSTDDADALEQSIRRGCRLVYLETPTNPTLKIIDLSRMIEAAKSVGALVVVDNTFATPINQTPLQLGADLVLHSATKFLCGHGDVMGGVVCGSKTLIEQIYRFRELTGPSMDPNTAFLLLRSLKTLGLRMSRHNENALAVAEFLQTQDRVRRVWYPGLENHPNHNAARRQMTGFGGVLSLELHGGMAAVDKFLTSLEYAHLAPNLGQVETVAGPTALTSHLELSPDEIKASGVSPELIRYSTGIEDADDLITDLRQALDAL